MQNGRYNLFYSYVLGLFLLKYKDKKNNKDKYKNVEEHKSRYEQNDASEQFWDVQIRDVDENLIKLIFP